MADGGRLRSAKRVGWGDPWVIRSFLLIGWVFNFCTLHLNMAHNVNKEFFLLCQQCLYYAHIYVMLCDLVSRKINKLAILQIFIKSVLTTDLSCVKFHELKKQMPMLWPHSWNSLSE